jgi:hypothetical protein
LKVFGKNGRDFALVRKVGDMNHKLPKATFGSAKKTNINNHQKWLRWNPRKQKQQIRSSIQNKKFSALLLITGSFIYGFSALGTFRPSPPDFVEGWPKIIIMGLGLGLMIWGMRFWESPK